MNDLKKFFSLKQVQRLQVSNIMNLYDFISYLPFDLKSILPLQNGNLNSQDWFLLEGQILAFEHRQGKSPFFTINFQTSYNFHLKIYWFVRGKWAFNFLKVGEFYQLIVNFQEPFYNLIKISEKKSSLNLDSFEIGRAEMKPYILPKYSKLGSLVSNDLQRLHQKIPKQYYQLNLTGLLPNNSIIPSVLDLSRIHKPKNQVDFYKGQQDWIALQTFLKLFLLKTINFEKGQEFGFKTRFSVDFLKKLSHNLDFNLSNSQKLVIWDILQEI